MSNEICFHRRMKCDSSRQVNWFSSINFIFFFQVYFLRTKINYPIGFTFWQRWYTCRHNCTLDRLCSPCPSYNALELIQLDENQVTICTLNIRHLHFRSSWPFFMKRMLKRSTRTKTMALKFIPRFTKNEFDRSEKICFGRTKLNLNFKPKSICLLSQFGCHSS